MQVQVRHTHTRRWRLLPGVDSALICPALACCHCTGRLRTCTNGAKADLQQVHQRLCHKQSAWPTALQLPKFFPWCTWAWHDALKSWHIGQCFAADCTALHYTCLMPISVQPQPPPLPAQRSSWLPPPRLRHQRRSAAAAKAKSVAVVKHQTGQIRRAAMIPALRALQIMVTDAVRAQRPQ